MKKLLYIVPHLSTGGLPQVALKRIEELKDEFEIFLICYQDSGREWFTVQKNKIKAIVSNITFLSDDASLRTQQLKNTIKEINPDIVHLEEIPELFMLDDDCEVIYDNNRTYKIVETCHSSTFNWMMKKTVPDVFSLISKLHMEQSKKNSLLDSVPKEIVEYPIKYRKRPPRKTAIEALDQDCKYKHVLMVGLFTPGKNQKEIFEIAEKMSDYNIVFHFVGNLAGNFKFYWSDFVPEDRTELPENIVVWDEQSDVNKFYSAFDLFYFSSKLECNPLVVKEALGWQMTILMYNLKSYCGSYDKYQSITFLTDDRENTVKSIKEILKPEHKKINDDCNFKVQLKNLYNNSHEKKNNVFPHTLKVDVNFINGPYAFISSTSTCTKYKVEFIDLDDDNNVVYSSSIKSGTWSRAYRQYYTNYRIVITNEATSKVEYEHFFNLYNKKVVIKLSSKALGDTLAWMPYVEEFRKKHTCEVYVKTFWNNLFKDRYTNLNFIEVDEDVEDHYAQYDIGWYWKDGVSNLYKNPSDARLIPLQKTATDILGLSFIEIKPKIKLDYDRPVNEKYVCIAMQSTLQTKYWNAYNGWESVVEHLNNIGYKVFCIDKHSSFGKEKCMNYIPKNAIDLTGDIPIEQRVQYLEHADFFIGLPSGMSWLAWACNTKVILISSFSKPFTEFKTNCYRIYNDNKWSGYFNNTDYDFIDFKSNWNWNPIKSCDTLDDWHSFETITAEQVKNEINKVAGNNICTTVSKLPKIKLVHLLSNPDEDREKKSISELSQLGESDIEYVQHINKPETFIPSIKRITEGERGTKTMPGHWGIYNAFRRAFYEFSDDVDFFMICECDCRLRVSPENFIEIIRKLCKIMDEEDIYYLSLGNFEPYSSITSEINEFIYETNWIIGTHCIVFSKKARNFILERSINMGWDSSDLWLNTMFSGYQKMAIVKEPIALQSCGRSLIDNNEPSPGSAFKRVGIDDDILEDALISKLNICNTLSARTERAIEEKNKRLNMCDKTRETWMKMNKYKKYEMETITVEHIKTAIDELTNSVSNDLKASIPHTTNQSQCCPQANASSCESSLLDNVLVLGPYGEELTENVGGMDYFKYYKVSCGDIVVDLGANIGSIAQEVLKSNPAMCYSVEASKALYNRLCASVAMFNNVICCHTVIGTASDKDKVYWQKDDAIDEVNILSFYEFVCKHEIKKIDFLKFDIEGAEFAIFEDEKSYKWISENVVNIVGEIHIDSRTKHKFFNLIEKIEVAGFDIIFESVDGVDITNRLLTNSVIAHCNKKAIDYYKEVILHGTKRNN